jgi:uncharacterized protein
MSLEYSSVHGYVLAASLILCLFTAQVADAAPDGTTVVDAAKAGDLTALRTLVRGAAAANAAAPDGTTALHWAAQRGDMAAVTLLIGRGARVDTANRYGVTALRVASEQGHLAAVEALLAAGADAKAVRSESGDTPLMIAARAGRTDVVRLLAARGAPVDVIEPLRGQTALMWAADERHPDVVKVLIDAGADTRVVSKSGLSALMFAIRAGDLESTRLLLAHADVNAPAKDGTSMLVLAILNARFDVARFLLEQGADANVNDPHGRPLHVLTFLRRSQSGNLSSGGNLPRYLPETGVDSFVLAEALLKHGADINAPYTANKGGTPRHMAVNSFLVGFDAATPFYIASAHMDVPFMRFLAERGANPTTPAATNVTPLLAASGIVAMPGAAPADHREALEAVKLAYELGNDPRAVIAPGGKGRLASDYIGASALHGAAMIGASELVKWLVEKGVPIDAKTSRGVTAYHYAAATDGRGGAVQRPWPETVAVILEIAKERRAALDTTPFPSKQ